jgi:hypothetical protein
MKPQLGCDAQKHAAGCKPRDLTDRLFSINFGGAAV